MITDAQFDAIFDQNEEALEVSITLGAKKLLVQTTRAIYEDPSPTWTNRDPQVLVASADSVLTAHQNLLSALAQYSVQRHPEDRIVSFFDALHWIADHINELPTLFGIPK